MSTGYADAHERCVDALNSMSIRMDAADLRMDALQVVNDEQQACILSHSKDGEACRLLTLERHVQQHGWEWDIEILFSESHLCKLRILHVCLSVQLPVV